MKDVPRAEYIELELRPEWAKCQECGDPGVVVYYYKHPDHGDVSFAHYCLDCGLNLKGVKEHLSHIESGVTTYSFRKGDRVYHVHNGRKGTVEGPQEDDFVESYWVQWDGYKRLDIVEPMFIRAEDPDHAMA